MPQLLLASASPARLATLQRAGVEPIVEVSGVDEPEVLRTASQRLGALSCADESLILARAKADDVAKSRRAATATPDSGADMPDIVVLGCDSILEFAGASFGKPANLGEARERWLRMSGSSGVLHTGHWLIDLTSGAAVGETSATRVHFAPVNEAEIDAYLATEEPLRVAGAFTIDGFGGWFIERIEGDHHGVVGVSLPLVRRLLGEMNRDITDFWS